MTTWRIPWALAQITGVLFSSLVWILITAASPVAAAAVLCAGVTLVWGRNTWLGLRWRFCARRATQPEAEAVLRALISVVALRGRHQPTIWIGRCSGGATISDNHLVIDRQLCGRILAVAISGEDVCRAVRRALALREVTSSRLVAWVELYCAPWLIVETAGRRVVAMVTVMPLLPLAWRVRWFVFAIAIVQSWQAGRWAAAAGVGVFAVLSWSTGFFRSRWTAALKRLGAAAYQGAQDWRGSSGDGPGRLRLVGTQPNLL